jgi:hypothetical protein
MLFCCNLSGHESALLQAIVDAVWMYTVSSVLFLLAAKFYPTNVMENMGPLMR